MEKDIEKTKEPVEFAPCKWCGKETSTPKSEAPLMGVTCSRRCRDELREHYE